MYFYIGKVIKYYNKEGTILTEDGQKYLFLEKDLVTSIKKNDTVIFRPEIVENTNRAYFVSNLNIYLEKDNNKNNLKEYIKNNIKGD